MKLSKSDVASFLLKPAYPRPLGALRIGVALVLLTQAWLVRGEILELFSSDGLVQGALANYFTPPFAPRIQWFAPLYNHLGVGEPTFVTLFCAVYFAVLCFLLAGLFTRTASIAAWFMHWTLMSTGSTMNYGADSYAHIFLFYFIFMPMGAAYSLDRLLGRVSGEPTPGTRLAIRLLQLHLCVSYLASGIEKAAGEQWWNGELLWRAFQLPVYRVFDMSWLVNHPWLSKLGGWGTLVMELGYSVFIWPKATRRIWVAGIVSLHLGIAIFLGLGVFGCIMSVLTLTLFGFSAEPSLDSYVLVPKIGTCPDKVAHELDAGGIA